MGMKRSETAQRAVVLERPQRLADPDRDGTLFVYDLSHSTESAAPHTPAAAAPHPPAATSWQTPEPTAPLPSAPALDEHPLARAALPGDAPALQEAMEASGLYAHDTVATRLRQGRRPYIVETDGLIASYGWVATTPEPIGDLGISFQLAPDEAYIYDCATRPAYRGRGYYPALLVAMLRDLRREGRRRVWIATAPGNVPSQRGIVRAGFTKVADVNMKRRPDGAVAPELYGVPGIPSDLLEQAARANQGRAIPDTGIPAE